MAQGIEHVPNEDTKQLVSELKAFGNTHEQIASILKITPETLLKHYRELLDNASALMGHKVAKNLVRKAIDDNDTSAMMFYLKTRCRWREKDKEEDKSSLIESLLQVIQSQQKD